MSKHNDPEIARQESAAARQERGYLESEKAATRTEGIYCGMCGDTGKQNGVKCPQIGCRAAAGEIPARVEVPRLDMSKMLCQEASHLSVNRYIACAQPATKLVLSERGRRLYPMCEGCADHNIRNRRAKLAAVHEAMNV